MLEFSHRGIEDRVRLGDIPTDDTRVSGRRPYLRIQLKSSVS